MHTRTKIAALAASLATTLAVAVGAVAFGSTGGPTDVALVERTADVEATTIPPAPTSTVAPVIADEPTDGPSTPTTRPAASPTTTVPAEAEPDPVGAPSPTTVAPAPTTTTVAPTWAVDYIDGHTAVLTSAPPTERYNYRESVSERGTTVEEWEIITCALDGPPFECFESTYRVG